MCIGDVLDPEALHVDRDMFHPARWWWIEKQAWMKYWISLSIWVREARDSGYS